MDVKAIAGADVGQFGQMQNFRAREILVGGHFDIAGFAFEHADAMARPFGERRIVGEIVEAGRSGAAMGVEDQIEGKGLRRLHDPQPAAIERCRQAAASIS